MFGAELGLMIVYRVLALFVAGIPPAAGKVCGSIASAKPLM